MTDIERRACEKRKEIRNARIEALAGLLIEEEDRVIRLRKSLADAEEITQVIKSVNVDDVEAVNKLLGRGSTSVTIDAGKVSIYSYGDN